MLTKINLSRLLPISPFVLIPALLITLKAFYASDFVIQAPPFFCILNTVVLFLIGCAVSIVAIRSYLAHGSPALFFLGSGVFTFGTGSLASLFKVSEGWGNVTSTTNDMASLLASMLLVIAVLACYLEWIPEPDTAKRRRNVLLTFPGISAFLVAVVILTANGITPVFFNENGPSLIRQIILSTALVLLSFSSIAIMHSYAKNGSPFFFWFSLGLMLRVIAQAAFFVQPAVGSPIGWLGVFSKHLASIYFLIAVRSAYLEGKEKGLSFKDAFSELVRVPGLYWQDIMENIGDAVVSVDSKGKILVWNKASERIFGYSRSEASGMNLDLITSENRPFDLESLLNGSSKTLETQLKRKDGSLACVDLSATRKKLSIGDVTTLVIRDITERKMAEQKLWQSRQQYKSVVMDQTELICRFIPNGILKFVNPAFCQMAEMEEHELIGQTFFMFLSDEDIYRVIKLMNEVTPGDPDRSIGLKVYVKDKTYYMHWNGRALFDSEGELVEYQAVGRDKTEQKLAEEALQEREAKLHSIVNAAPVGIGLTVNRHLTEVNNSICEMMGYSANELLGKSARILYPSDEVYDYVGTVKYQMIREKGIGTVETQMQHKSGKILDVLMSSTPIDPEHLEKGVTFSVLDITDRKLAEKALKEANNYLESKVRERTAQLSKTNDSLITEIEERKRTEKSLRLAQKNLRAMASEVIFAEERSRQHFATDLHDTVVQTLGAAKLRGQLIQDQIPPDAQPVFTELQDMLSESIIQARQIMSEISPPVLYELGFIPALEWLADQVGSTNNINIKLKGDCDVDLCHDVQVLLFQAVRELLLNIVKHAQAKEALVAVTGDQKCIRISVKDNGKGFDGKISFRTETNRGFGLFSIRERLKHLGGKLIINSTPGQGTRVVMVAPRI